MVYSTKTASEENAYEFIYGHKNTIMNRCLEISDIKHKGIDILFCKLIIVIIIHFIGTYYQYDTLILPKLPSTSLLTTTVQLFSSFVRGSTQNETPEKLPIPGENVIRKLCMEYFLLPSKELFIKGNFYEKYDISSATDRFVHLYECCFKQKVLPKDGYQSIPVTDNSVKEVSCTTNMTVLIMK